MQKTNIIQQRDLNPILSKANEIVRHYEIAGNCTASVMGADYVSVFHSKNSKALLFCTLCKRYCKNAINLKPNDFPCSEMHRQAIKEAQKQGGSHTYICPLGFFFWTSPFFSGERFAGAFISGGLLSIEKKELFNKIHSVCKGDIPYSEINQYLNNIPKKTSYDVSMLARMMQLCAEQISNRESYKTEETENTKIPEPPEKILDMERHLIASLRRGDNNEARKIITGLLNSIYEENKLEHIKIRAIELIALLSRTGASQENYNELFEINDKFIKRIEKSESFNEIVDFLCTLAELMSWKIFSFKGLRHAYALRKAERFIWKNFTRKVSLKEIADASGLSAPYFSTIFKEEMGENLSSYLNRLKVEKASAMLRETDYSIRKISCECGFVDQSWFSKIFNGFTGYSPNKFRENIGINP